MRDTITVSASDMSTSSAAGAARTAHRMRHSLRANVGPRSTAAAAAVARGLWRCWLPLHVRWCCRKQGASSWWCASSGVAAGSLASQPRAAGAIAREGRHATHAQPRQAGGGAALGW
jgi:hypothetical protein